MTNARHMLLTSIHDVSPRFEGEIDALFDRIAPLSGSDHLAMLVVPDYWGLAPLHKSPAFCRKLRNWAGQGVEMFLHGWHHRVDRPPLRRIDRIRGNFITACEGEFLAMDRLNAIQKMRDGRKLIEDIISGPVSGFIAPEWLYSEGALDAKPGALSAHEQRDNVIGVNSQADEHQGQWINHHNKRPKT